ncbi:hypothetical protein [Nonomuraea africana]|uniref:Uncharacterized protein n=1 Tax=Nonomuraea africana TaxID=46171 RepID=A0ABR9KTC9_9ACTN|nr:hypothetical protein [Nonomuraea africana]MBE1565294.1 hypothetical protein [Nonomuraea africana]
MSTADGRSLAAMLDLLVYENVLVAWRVRSGVYEIVLHDGEEIAMSRDQAAMWSLGAFEVFLAFVDQGRIIPRMP